MSMPSFSTQAEAGEFGSFEIACTSASELLGLLPPFGEWWRDPRRRHDSWVFRGQADARWPLTPSLLRPEALTRAATRFGVYDSDDTTAKVDRRRFEVETLQAFLHGVDLQGLPIPEDSQLTRDPEHKTTPASWWESALGLYDHGGDGLWPPISMLSNLALAQHYGVPTVLVDWSRHPYVALYFAATSSLENNGDARELALWCLNETYVRRFGRGQEEGQVLMVTAPYASNPNLRAQAGVFSVVRTKAYDHPADGLDARYLQVHEDPTIGFHLPYLIRYKLALDNGAARELLRMLADAGVTAATMFPGHAGVVRWLEERTSYKVRRWE